MRRILLTLVAAALLAPQANAQLPFFKKKKKEKPPAEAAAKTPAETAAPGTPPAPGAPQTPPGAAPAVSSTAGAPAPGQVPTLGPEEEAALKRAMDSARAADARWAGDTSLAHARERMDRWKVVQFTLPATDGRQQIVAQYIEQAKKDLDAANAQASQAGRQDSESKKLVETTMREAQSLYESKDYSGAEAKLNSVLAYDPFNRDAAQLMPKVKHGKQIKSAMMTAAMYGVILIPLLALLALAGRWLYKRHEENQKKAEDLAAKRTAVLQIVDGVGRGKLVTLDREKTIFKIGAAAAQQDSDKNDLVISDSAAQVSRFHCTLVRKDGNYFVVDSSVNGTVINGEPLKRGEHYPLEDGDEITVAQVSRLKFLHT